MIEAAKQNFNQSKGLKDWQIKASEIEASEGLEESIKFVQSTAVARAQEIMERVGVEEEKSSREELGKTRSKGSNRYTGKAFGVERVSKPVVLSPESAFAIRRFEPTYARIIENRTDEHSRRRPLPLMLGERALSDEPSSSRGVIHIAKYYGSPPEDLKDEAGRAQFGASVVLPGDDKQVAKYATDWVDLYQLQNFMKEVELMGEDLDRQGVPRIEIPDIASVDPRTS